jgi:hypothetical protein
MSPSGTTVLALLLLAIGPGRVRAADFTAEMVARTFFHGLLEGRPEAALQLCAAEVNLDGQRVRDRGELQRALGAISTRARSRSLSLRQLLLLEPGEALRRYGPPPRRLGDALRPGRLVALARFGSLGAAAVLRREGGFWRVTALTD